MDYKLIKNFFIDIKKWFEIVGNICLNDIIIKYKCIIKNDIYSTIRSLCHGLNVTHIQTSMKDTLRTIKNCIDKCNYYLREEKLNRIVNEL